jgi:hypothetical protein
MDAACKPAIGDVVRLPDSLTGYSDDPGKVRWCIVVADLGFSMRVLPRSKTSKEGILVPASAMDEFTEDGRVFNKLKTVRVDALREMQNIGQLPEEYLVEVLKMALSRRRGER